MNEPDTYRGKTFCVEYDKQEGLYFCPICDNVVDDFKDQCDECGAFLDWTQFE